MSTFICVSGKAQNGKDTVASYLSKQLTNKYGKSVLVTHYADLLKYICKMYFNWDGNKDEKGRTLLQKVGTDIIREKQPDFWVNFIIEMVNFFPHTWDYVIIPDARFPNELARISDSGYDMIHIKVQRTNFESNLTNEQKNHPSETSLDGTSANYVIYNSGTLNDLYNNIDEVLKKVQKEKND